MKKNLLLQGMIFLIALVGLYSCEKPLPTGDFTSSVDGFDVTFTTADISEVSDYLWDFGDETTSTEANPVHTYLLSGTYTVVLTLTGDGGSITATHDVQILPDFLEMLTGGPAATNGKTWVLSTGYVDGVDGGSGVEPTMTIVFGSMENLLTNIGFPDEYDNEFTFFADGKYVVDNKNGFSACNLLYGLFGALGETVRTVAADPINICAKAYTAPASATWTLHTDDLVIAAAVHGGTDIPATTYDATFTGKNWIDISDEAYFGILDYPTSRKFIIKSITPESMTVAIFMAGYWSDPSGSGMYPTLMYHMTFVPKQ